jgi:hypothetical protein
MNTVDDVIESERSSEKNLPQQGRTTGMRKDTLNLQADENRQPNDNQITERAVVNNNSSS